MIKLHVPLRVVYVDCARFHWHQVRAKHHVPKAIVVHVLETGLFLGAIHVDSLVLLVDFAVNFTSDMICGQMNVVENLLLPCVLEHLILF